MKWIRFFAVSAILSGSVNLVSEALEPKQDAIWQAVHDNGFRQEGDALRDDQRNPEAFLRFLGIAPDMTVAEINPGGGWYSRILAPFVKQDGLYVGLEHHPDRYKGSERYQHMLGAYPAKVEENRTMYGDAAIATWIPASEGLPVEAGTLDAAIIVRALHNWYRRGFFDEGFRQLHAMMKPGAVLGVVQHRADPEQAGDIHALANRGRWKQAALIQAIEARGFKLVATSEMNANPKDTKDYPRGVWTLPPILALGDQDKARYQAVGESDRMTLKFIRTAND